MTESGAAASGGRSGAVTTLTRVLLLDEGGVISRSGDSAGRAVMMRAADEVERGTRPQPDDVVADGFALLELVRAAVTGGGRHVGDR